MSTPAEILSKLNAILESMANTVNAVGPTRLLTLDRATRANAALVYLREGGHERFRWGLAPEDKDFVIQYSPDGTPFTYDDRLRIDSETGKVTVKGLSLDGADFANTRLTGQTRFADGSAAAPAVTREGDSNTGFFFPETDQIAAAVAGSELARFTPTGLAIGKDTASYPLDVGGAGRVEVLNIVGTAPVINFSDTDNAVTGQIGSGTSDFNITSNVSIDIRPNNVRAGFISNSGWQFFANETEVARFTSAGLAIGTSSAVAPLDVRGGIAVSPVGQSTWSPPTDFINLLSGDNTSNNSVPLLALMSDRADQYATINCRRYGASSQIGLGFSVSNGSGPYEAMVLSNTGRLGLGLDTPLTALHMRQTAPIMRMDSVGGVYGYNLKANVSDANDYGFVIEDLAGTDLYLIRAGGAGVGYHQWLIDGVEAMRIDSAGRVGIGTSVPNTDLHISSAYPAIRLQDTDAAYSQIHANGSILALQADPLNTAANSRIQFEVDNVECVRIDSFGNLLIGTTTSGASKLVVNDDSVQVTTPKTPASATDTGETGQIAWDDEHIYVCTAPDTWKRAALTTW